MLKRFIYGGRDRPVPMIHHMEHIYVIIAHMGYPGFDVKSCAGATFLEIANMGAP